MVTLSEYRDLIHLDDPFPLPTKDARTGRDLLMTALSGLPNKRYTGTSSVAHLATDESLLRWLDAELTQRDPGPLDPITERAINSILLRVSGKHGRVEALNLRRVNDMFPENDYPRAFNTAIYLGDIRQLVVDAVVNSAMPDLTGCRIPLHGCLDSVIHLQAGPWMRNDGAAIMDVLGHEAETGSAVITRGYRMPARYVIHTVAPEVHTGTPAQRDRELLRDCYWNCLELAREKGDISTIAFPALATGGNGFPFDIAAKIALQTVDDWMHIHASQLELVLFSVHNDEDLAHMERVLTTWVNE
ncbi:MAG: macro domain-containing protein [Actinomycetaceae bacterium]|nr:macro domain-containing protein [Arcanobacterium sp.]MDD7686585.1 macro domain-containing protein [Actinomycetaceae bacterium]MDY5273091.1 macro domain-containing protein [Arcanobacterium sp.]